jgi:hypothetical protein
VNTPVPKCHVALGAIVVAWFCLVAYRYDTDEKSLQSDVMKKAGISLEARRDAKDAFKRAHVPRATHDADYLARHALRASQMSTTHFVSLGHVDTGNQRDSAIVVLRDGLGVRCPGGQPPR